MPPEAPQPRLIVVARSFRQNSSAEQTGCGHLVVEDRLNDAVADAVDIGMAEGAGEHDHHQADRRHADDVLHVGAARQTRKIVFHDHEQANERPRGDSAQDAEIHERQPLLEAEGLRQRKLDLGNDEGRVRPDQDSADQCRGAGRDDDRKKSPVGNLGQQDFEREQHAAERRVESRRNAGASAGGKQRHLLQGREPDRLGKGRTQRRADLNDRTFPPDRRSAADRQSRGQRLDDRDLPADVAAAVEDRVHHLGHAVSLGLGREALNEEDDDHPADDRREDQEIAEGAWPFEEVGVVVEAEEATVESVVDEPDQRAQPHRPESRKHADEEREKAEDEKADAPLLLRARSRGHENRLIACLQGMG